MLTVQTRSSDPPLIILTVPKWLNILNSILPLIHIQQTEFKYFNSLDYHLSLPCVFPSILLVLLVPSLYRSLTVSLSLCFYIIFSKISALQTAT
jgi:hypothetical protein